MKYIAICSIVLFAAAVSAQDYVVGEYYAPYGTCTSIETKSGETVYDIPRRYYREEPAVRTEYYPQTGYYPRRVRYAEPVYCPAPVYYNPYRYSNCWSRRRHHGYWRDRRYYRRWCRDFRRCMRRCDD